MFSTIGNGAPVTTDELLPRKAAPGASGAALPQPPSQLSGRSFQNHSGARPPMVAIADDDLEFANYLKTFLEGRGYQTRIYAHGEDLVGAAQRGDLPDVVLLDVMMPGMDGLATL